MGSIVDGISSLFGGGSANRGAQRDTNSQGSALGAAGGALGQAPGYFNQDANTLGGAAGALGSQTGALQGETADGSQQTGLAGTAAQSYYANYGNAINAALGADGFTPNASGGGMSYNSSFDPYANTKGSLISQYSDSVAPQYQNAVNASQHDDLSRGITGANTIGPAQDQQIRTAQASDVANFGRNLGVQAQQEQYNRLGNAVNLINGAGQTAQQGYGSAAQTYGNVAQGYGSQAGGYGNLAAGYGNVGQDYQNQAGDYGNLAAGYGGQAQTYQNQATNQGNNLAGLAGLFTPAGGFGGHL